jgi:hypothetical protein
VSQFESFDHIFGHDAPPREPGRKIDIISAQPGMEIRCVITSEWILTCRTHWLGAGDSKPCFRTAECPWCKMRLPSRWKGYLCGFLTTTYGACIIEVTAGAAEACPALIDRATALRGKIIALTRRGASANAPCHASLSERTGMLLRATLPQPFDLLKALFRIWRFDPAVFTTKTVSEEEAREQIPEEDA